CQIIVFFIPAEVGIRCRNVTGVQTCALPIYLWGAYSFSSPLGGSMVYRDAPVDKRPVRGRRHTALYRCWEYLSCFATNPGCVENPLIKRLSIAPDFGGYFGI